MVKFPIRTARIFEIVFLLKLLVSGGGEEEDVDQDSLSIQVNSSCRFCFSSQKMNWKIEAI